MIRAVVLDAGPLGRIAHPQSEDGTVKLWDPVTGQERATLKGHTNRVYPVVFSPDGKTLATGGEDGTVRLWYAATDEEAEAPGK